MPCLFVSFLIHTDTDKYTYFHKSFAYRMCVRGTRGLLRKHLYHLYLYWPREPVLSGTPQCPPPWPCTPASSFCAPSGWGFSSSVQSSLSFFYILPTLTPPVREGNRNFPPSSPDGMGWGWLSFAKIVKDNILCKRKSVGGKRGWKVKAWVKTWVKTWVKVYTLCCI